MKKDLKNICCCDSLWISVERDELVYDPVLKWFGFRTDKKNPKIYQVMRYCPFCGAKLPNLGYKFEEVVEEELGECMLPESWFPKDRKHLPKEFQTDEWWIRRKL